MSLSATGIKRNLAKRKLFSHSSASSSRNNISKNNNNATTRPPAPSYTAATASSAAKKEKNAIRFASPLVKRIRQEILRSLPLQTTSVVLALNARGEPSKSNSHHVHVARSLADRRQRRQVRTSQRFQRHVQSRVPTAAVRVTPSQTSRTPLDTTAKQGLFTPPQHQQHGASSTGRPPFTTTSNTSTTSTSQKQRIRKTYSYTKFLNSSSSPLTPGVAVAAGSNKTLVATRSQSSFLKTPKQKRHTATTTPKSNFKTPRSAANADGSGASTRRNLDKRTARLLHAESFALGIDRLLSNENSQTNSSSTADTQQPPPISGDGHGAGGISVLVRKRPLFAHERERGDFNVVTVPRNQKSVVVFSTRLESDMRTKTIQPFTFSESFCNTMNNSNTTRSTFTALDETATSRDAYERILQPWVRRALRLHLIVEPNNDRQQQQREDEPNPATVLMFGQTGSGKSFTMSGMEEQLANDLFSSSNNNTIAVRVYFMQLKGKVVQDLMKDDAGTTTSSVRILDGPDGSVRLSGAKSVLVESAAELLQVLETAKGKRATHATDRNSVSSRSHAVCQLEIIHSSRIGGYHVNMKPKKGSILTLVDCAGTERNNDSLYHSVERQAESAEINSSLYALKECIRAKKLQHKHVPYRQSTLTRLLRESMENPKAHFAVLATVAPNATDTEHTLTTLETVATLLETTCHQGKRTKVQAVVVPRTNGMGNGSLVVEAATPPKTWTHHELIRFLQKKGCLLDEFSGNSNKKLIPESINGQRIMRMTKVQLRNTFFEDGQDEKADYLFQTLRSETNRVARLELKRRIAISKSNSPK